MKFNKFFALLLCGVFALSSVSLADVTVKSAGVKKGTAVYIDTAGGLTASCSGSTCTLNTGTPAISGGTINGATIGATTPAAGSFSALAAGGLAQAANTWRYVANGIEFEGATADAFETTLSAVDPTADQQISLPNNAVNSSVLTSTLTTNAIDAANSVWAESGALVFEGATANAFEGRITSSDWTADQVHTLPDMTGAYLMSTLATNNLDAANSIWATSNNLKFEGATADAFETAITPTDATAARTLTLPDDSGTVMLASTTALTPGTTVTWNPASGTVFTDVPATAQTINMTATRAVSGTRVNLVVTTSGTSSFTLTFGSNFKSNGTLVTGTVSGIVYTVSFAYDGTNWNEISRIRAGAPNFALVDAPTIALGTAEGLKVYTYTPAQTNTINCAVVPKAGDYFDLVYTTSGVSSFTTTFGTNFKSTGTLATGTTTAKVFVIKFVSDGTNMNEVSRTTAM